MEDVAVVIVHPTEGYVRHMEYGIRGLAELYAYPSSELDLRFDSIFSHYRNAQRCVVAPSGLSTLMWRNDNILLAKRLGTREDDVVISDFTNPSAQLSYRGKIFREMAKTYTDNIDWDWVVKDAVSNMGLGPNVRLIVGGFALRDCVAKFAKAASRMGYSAYIDDTMTELFYNYLRLDIIHDNPGWQTFYPIEEMDRILKQRKRSK